MLPNHNVQGKIGQYDRGYHDGANIMLPEIPGGYSKHVASQHKVAYDAGQQRGYHFKSNIDQQNSAMLAKLMSRKKSYERLMRNGDDTGGTRSPAGPIPDLSSAKKHMV